MRPAEVRPSGKCKACAHVVAKRVNCHDPHFAHANVCLRKREARQVEVAVATATSEEGRFGGGGERLGIRGGQRDGGVGGLGRGVQFVFFGASPLLFSPLSLFVSAVWEEGDGGAQPHFDGRALHGFAKDCRTETGFGHIYQQLS